MCPQVTVVKIRHALKMRERDVILAFVSWNFHFLFGGKSFIDMEHTATAILRCVISNTHPNYVLHY